MIPSKNTISQNSLQQDSIYLENNNEKISFSSEGMMPTQEPSVHPSLSLPGAGGLQIAGTDEEPPLPSSLHHARQERLIRQEAEEEKTEVIRPGAYAIQQWNTAEPLNVGFLSPAINTSIRGQVQQQEQQQSVEQEAIVAELVTPPELVVADPLTTNTGMLELEALAPVQREVKILKRRVIWVVLLAIVIMAALVGGLAGGSNNRSSQNSNINVVSETIQISSIIQSRSPTTTFEDPMSPQSLALEWMVTEDQIVPSLLSDSMDQLIIQRFALVTLWFATGGLTTWAYDDDLELGWLNIMSSECEWNSQDFTCLPEGTVTALDLVQNGLSGSLPRELGLLTALTLLNMLANQLTGNVPSELGMLTALTWLRLGRNQLSGQVPSELGQLTALTRLELDFNQFSGQIPSELGVLTSLTHMNLFENQLTGKIPTEVGFLTKLTFFHIYNNQLAGQLPTELGKLTALEVLWLFGTQLTGKIPTELGLLTALTWMDLESNQLSGEMPTELGLLTALTLLNLSSNRLTGKLPSELGNLPSLRVLWLVDNQLTGQVPSELGELGTLGFLGLFNNTLMGSLSTTLCAISDLQPQIDCGDLQCNCCSDGNETPCIV